MKNNFEILINRLTPTLRRISHRLNGRFTFFNDDDLCQEALTHLWVMFNKGTLCDKTDSYILQGCYFHLKNYIRTSADKAKLISFEMPIDEDGTMLEDIIPSPDTSAADLSVNNGLQEEIAARGLDKRELEIIKMSIEGMTTREIGDRLDISHVAVVKLKKKIRSKCGRLEEGVREGYQN